MNRPNIAAVILAAGASRRLGQPKQLLQYKGETLIARAVRIAQESNLEPIIAVLGAQSDAVRAALAASRTVIIENDQWEEGIAGSMRVGLTALEGIAPDLDGVLIMPCDQPRLTSEHLSRLVDGFADTIVASTYAGVRGVPALFPWHARSQLMQLSGDVGARKLLADPLKQVIDVPFEQGELDIDVPEDLEHLR